MSLRSTHSGRFRVVYVALGVALVAAAAIALLAGVAGRTRPRPLVVKGSLSDAPRYVVFAERASDVPAGLLTRMRRVKSSPPGLVFASRCWVARYTVFGSVAAPESPLNTAERVLRRSGALQPGLLGQMTLSHAAVVDFAKRMAVAVSKPDPPVFAALVMRWRRNAACAQERRDVELKAALDSLSTFTISSATAE